VRVLGCPTREQARVRLQVATSRLGRTDFPPVEGYASDSEDAGYFLLGEIVRLA
jgi:hypothetical protein